jgi:hypothetical protein
MALHILRVARRCDDIAELRKLQRERAKERGFYCFYTRNTPKRADEILEGGSVYWVIKGYIQARQRIRGFLPIVNRRGRPAVLVKIEAKITPTEGRPHRAFQGWRYVTDTEVPRDLPKAGRGKAMPPAMARELRELGLL